MPFVQDLILFISFSNMFVRVSKKMTIELY